MKVSSTTLFLTTALGVAAHPSGHGHQHLHRSLEGRADYVMAKKPVVVTVTVEAPAPTSSSPPPASPPQPQTPSSAGPVPVVKPASASTAVSPVAKPGPSSSSSSGSGSGSGSGASSYKPFCGGHPQKRATAEQIAYKGNVGAANNYGCNLMLIQQSIADKYDYTATFKNAGNQEQECVCWLKIGPTGLINGFFQGNEALTFKLPAGGQQVLAADSNTQGGCTCGAGAVAKTQNGQYANTWLEFDFGNESNNGWSGADASCLVASDAGLTIPGLNVCQATSSSTTCSTIKPGGSGTNAYLANTHNLDGVGLNIKDTPVRLDVTVDYQG